MKYLLTVIILISFLLSCSKNKDGVKPVQEMATIDSVKVHRLSSSEFATDIFITVKDTSLTGLEFFRVPGFLIGKISNPRTGHYTITGLAFPPPSAGYYNIELTTFGWRYQLPQFALVF